MKTKTRKYAKVVLAIVLMLAMVMQTWSGSGIRAKADTGTGGYQELSFSDWGILNSTYSAGVTLSSQVGLTTMDGVAFTGKICFNGNQQWIRIGSPNGWNGILFVGRNDGLVVCSQVEGYADDGQLVSYTKKNLLTEEFKLRLTFDIDDSNNLTLGIWIDDVFQTSFTYTGIAVAMGTTMLFDATGLTVTDAVWEYTELSFSDWRITEGTYTASSVYNLQNGLTSLDRTAFTGKICFNGNQQWIRIGSPNGWNGILFVGRNDGLVVCSQVEGYTDSGQLVSYTKKNLLTEEFKLRLTFDIDDSNNLTLGIWIDDVFQTSFTYTGIAVAMGTTMLFDATGLTVTDAEKEYTDVTFSDWNIVDGAYTAGIGYSLANGMTSLNGAAFNGTITRGAGSYIRFGGGNNAWAGILILGTSSGLTLDCEIAGYTGKDIDIAYISKNLATDSFNLRLTMDYDVDNNLVLGVWINGVFQRYITYKGMATVFGTAMLMDSAGLTLSDLSTGEKPELTNITTNNFGIVYEEYASTTCVASTTTTSLINTSFRGKVLFNKVNESSGDYYICYAAQGTNWDGMRIVPSSNGTLRLYDPYDLSCIDVTLTAPESLGSFVGTEFELGVDLWADGNDAKVVIYINGEQYNSAPYVWTNAIANNRVGNNMNFIVSASGDSIIMGEEQPLEQLPTDFMEITLNDFGFADGTYTDVSKKNLAINGTATLDRKILSAKISCVDGNMQLFYGAKDSDWSGLYFLFCPNSNEILLQQGTAGSAYTFTASEGGFDFTNGNPVNLKITTEYVDGSATDSDLKVGVFINGVLYDNQYIIMSDFVASLSDGVSIHRADGATGSLTISTPKRMLPSNFDQLTFSDIGIAGFRDEQGGSNRAINWDGMIFSGKASLDTTGSEIRLGAKDGWVGYSLLMNASGSLVLNDIGITDTDIAEFADVNPGETFSFSFATEMVDADNDGASNDLKFGLWINDVMYGNRWFYHMDYSLNGAADSGLTILMDIGTEKAGTFGDYNPNTQSGTQDNGKYYYNLAEGEYLLSTGGSIVVNDVSMSSGDVLSHAGDYSIVRTEGNAEYTSTVILYQTGDAHPDGKTSVADLVAIKKVIANIELTTESGLKGADITKDNAVDKADLEMIRDVLLGKNTIDTSIDVPSVSFASGDAKVMPIGGYYGAYDNLLTDDVYQKIKDSGINLVTWSIDTYNVDGETDSVIAQLKLAEKYGISLFIRDKALSNKQYTSQELANQIAEYSMYKSFKGLTIVDEPSATNGTYGSNESLSTYSSLASIVNQYANLSGYTNLYPLAEELGDSTAYGNYLDEYCKTYNPKMLSFDDYPFNEGSSVKVTSCAQYFENLAIVRNKAMEYDIPFWTFVQAGKWYNTSSLGSSDLTLAQMKWNANMALAFGAKGIQYFPMIDPSRRSTDSNATWTGNGLIDTDGNITEWYSYAQSINAQIAAVDDVLMSSINEGVMIDGTYAENNINNCGVTILDSFNEVTGITSNDTSWTEYGAVVGCFDYYGKTALYVVNYNTNGTNNVTLSFNGTCSTQTITSAGVTTASGTSLNVNLAAGEAALVVIE